VRARWTVFFFGHILYLSRDEGAGGLHWYGGVTVLLPGQVIGK
jgi:hypothetical protein